MTTRNDNADNVSGIEVDSYAAALEHATSSYYVLPVQVRSEAGSQAFHRNFRLADVAQSGKVHYERRPKEKRAVNFRDKWPV